MKRRMVTEKVPKLTAHSIRPGFENEPAWTLAEAGQHANGIDVAAIRYQWRTPMLGDDGRLHRRWRRTSRRHPLRVDAASFKLYFKTSKPQGPVV